MNSSANSDFGELEVSHENVVVRFLTCEDGANGDFNVEDPEDELTLRFDVNEAGKCNGEGPHGHDESRNTRINAHQVDRDKLRAFAQEMAKDFASLGDASWKTRADECSWTTTEQVNDGVS